MRVGLLRRRERLLRLRNLRLGLGSIFDLGLRFGTALGCILARRLLGFVAFVFAIGNQRIFALGLSFGTALGGVLVRSLLVVGD